MKNRLTKNLLSAALIATVDAQNRDKPGGGQGNQGNFGAPNSLRDGHVNRQTVRKPSGEREGNRENTRKPKPGQGRKPGTGMSHVDRPGQNGQKPKPRPNLKELLDLTDEQAKALRAARKKWHEYAKPIHENKELSKEEKHAELHEGFHKFNAALKEILNEKQYAQLQELRRRRARPNDREQQAGGQNQNRRKPNGADLRRRIAEALKLTDEQKEKLHAVHHYAIKKIKVILDNKELSKEEKEAEIKAIHQTVRNRRKEIFTDEQKARLRGIHAFLRSQRENQTQPVSTENGRGRGNREQGRPQRRPQQGGNQEQGRPQRRPQGDEQEQSRPEQGGNSNDIHARIDEPEQLIANQRRWLSMINYVVRPGEQTLWY